MGLKDESMLKGVIDWIESGPEGHIERAKNEAILGWRHGSSDKPPTPFMIRKSKSYFVGYKEGYLQYLRETRAEDLAEHIDAIVEWFEDYHEGKVDDRQVLILLAVRS